jgi:hypothetical protein
MNSLNINLHKITAVRSRLCAAILCAGNLEFLLKTKSEVGFSGGKFEIFFNFSFLNNSKRLWIKDKTRDLNY